MSHQYSRRRMLQLLGASGAGFALAACGTNSSNANRNRRLNSTKFDIPDGGPDFPKGPVKLRWVDNGDQKAVFWKAFFSALEKKYPNVTVDYEGTNTNTLSQEVSLGLRNGTAPNVFYLPVSITPGEAVSNGWAVPLDDFIPNWKTLKAGFPPESYAPGKTDFGGKTYSFDCITNQRLGNGLLYNTDYMHQAGYDPTKILSWDEFRSAAKKVTKRGAGNYYGIIMGMGQSAQVSQFVDTLAETAGAYGGEFNPTTGNYNFSSDIYLEATELFLAMKSDGSFFPDSISYDAPHARGVFPDGVAAMMLQGPWNIPQWRASNPDFKFGVNLNPMKNPKRFWPIPYLAGGAGGWWTYSKNTKPQLAVLRLVYSYLSTLKGQTEWADFDGAGDPPMLRAAIQHAHMDPISRHALDLGYKYLVLEPDPSVTAKNYSTYQELYKPPQPSWANTLVGLYTGQIKTDAKTTLKNVQDRYEKAMDDAIAATKAQGLSISRQEFTFPHWDPTKPYKYPGGG